MTKIKHIYIVSITMLLWVVLLGVYNLMISMIDMTTMVSEAIVIEALVQEVMPYILYTIALLVLVIYIRYNSSWIEGSFKEELHIYIALAMMAFSAVRLVEFPFAGIKLLMTGLLLQEKVIAETMMLAEYLLSLIMITPFIIGYIILLKRYGAWFLQHIDAEKTVYSYIVIHSMFVMYTFSTLQRFISIVISEETIVAQFLWIEVIHIMSVTLVIAAIMWVVLNGLKASYQLQRGQSLQFSHYKGYIGISLVFSFMYSLFAIPNLFQTIYDAIASGDQAYIAYMIPKKLVEIGMPLMGVILGFVWIKQDPNGFAQSIEIHEGISEE